MIKYLIFRLVFFFEIASISIFLNAKWGWLLKFLIQIQDCFLNRTIYFFFVIVLFCLLFYFYSYLFIFTTLLLLKEYRQNKNLIKLHPSKVLEQVSSCWNYLIKFERHQFLFYGIIIFILLSFKIPLFANYKAYTINSERDDKLDVNFEFSYLIEQGNYNIVVGRGTNTERRLELALKSIDPESISNTYYFDKSAAIIKYFHYYECAEICYESEEIYSITDWIKTFIRSLLDALIRAVIYGIIPYLIGLVIINRKVINREYCLNDEEVNLKDSSHLNH